MRILVLLLYLLPVSLPAEVKFTDNFESGDLSGWELMNPQAVRVVDSGHTGHGKVLELQADDAVVALVRDSGQWGALRVEGDMLFPDNGHNYLAFVYHFHRGDGRKDFGSLYVKGNGSYIRANPWRDLNVSRLLYEEYFTSLQSEDAIQVGEWHRFRMEVLGEHCHLYIDDMSTPKITFSLFERTSGQVGFNSRVTGSPVWIDNVQVSAIRELGYKGPDIPEIHYQAEKLITDWEVLGPFEGTSNAVEQSSPANPLSAANPALAWRPFNTDSRGAVISGRVSEFRSGRPVAYFRTTRTEPEQRRAILHVSSTDELALWLNGRFLGYLYRQGYMDEGDWNAWYDFSENPGHAGRRVSIDLEPGENHLVIRSYNGQFASGGFFARWEEP